MKKISRSPFFHKRLFPFLFASLFLLFALLPETGVPHPPPRFFVLLPGIALLIVTVMWRKLFANLAEEVWDCGDHLRIKTGGHDFIAPLANIVNVSSNLLMNPPMVTLRLRVPGPTGRDVTFLPAFSRSLGLRLSFSRSNPELDQLVDRIDAARQRAAQG